MNHQELYNLLKTVRKNIRCPQCGKQYDFAQIKIRGFADYIIFLELDCKDHMPVLATVAIPRKSVKKNEGKTIDVDDVIETYKFLEKFPGGFEKIFKNSNK